LGLAASSRWLQQWVTGTSDESTKVSLSNRFVTDNVEVSKEVNGSSVSSTTSSSPRCGLRIRQQLYGSTIALGLTGILVTLANQMEHKMASLIPGTACGILACITPFVRRWIAPPQALAVAPFWSQVLFLMLFASIGLTANVGSAIRAGPGCLILSLLALLVHVMVVLGSTALWNRVVVRLQYSQFKGHRFFKIGLEETLIASNAAIGGPATAAAWAGQRAPQWALAATVWGIGKSSPEISTIRDM
jgi:uncharacterized membrane protein